MIIKPPEKPVSKAVSGKKYESENSGLQGLLNDSK